MNKLQDWLGETPARCALLLYLSVGLVQLWVIPPGLEAWLGLHWMAAVLCAAVLAWIPVFGQALALTAAVVVLGWPAPLAAALFLWPIWFAGAIYVVHRFKGRGDHVGGRRDEGSFERSLQALRERGSRSRDDDAPPDLRTARLD